MDVRQEWGRGFAYSIMGPTSRSVSDILVRGWPVRGNLDSAVKLADEYKCQGRLEADLMPSEPGRPETSGRAINLASCRLLRITAEIAGMWSLKVGG